jgi:transcriptional regulator with XRE-family HTH domain
MSKHKTFKEWRELRGLSREELAEKTWLDEELIARIEEVGVPTPASIRKADDFGSEVLDSISEALDIEEGVGYDVAPIEANPGDYVLNPTALAALDPGIVEFLKEHAEELDLRVGIPNQWDVALKPIGKVSLEDAENIKAWRQEENAYRKEMLQHIRDFNALGLEHTTDPNAKIGEVLEWRDGRWVPKPPKEEES